MVALADTFRRLLDRHIDMHEIEGYGSPTDSSTYIYIRQFCIQHTNSQWVLDYLTTRALWKTSLIPCIQHLLPTNHLCHLLKENLPRIFNCFPVTGVRHWPIISWFVSIVFLKKRTNIGYSPSSVATN